MPGVVVGNFINTSKTGLKAVLDAAGLNLIVTKAKDVQLPASSEDVTVKYSILGVSDIISLDNANNKLVIADIPHGLHERVHLQIDLSSGSYKTTVFQYVEIWGKTEQEMVDDEHLQLYLDTSKALIAPSSMSLPTAGSIYGSSVEISWKLKEAKPYAKVTYPGTLTIDMTTLKNETITLVATIKVKGNKELSATKEFTYTVSQMVAETTDLKANSAYSLVINQNSRGEMLFVQSKMNGFYIATSTNMEDGAKWYADKVEGGINIYYKDKDTKVYLSAEPAWNTSKDYYTTNIVLSKTIKSVWVLDEAGYYKTTADKFKDKDLTQKDGTVTLFLGTSSTFNTLSLSDVNDKKVTADKIGSEFFPVYFAQVDKINNASAETTANLATGSLQVPGKVSKDGWSYTLPGVDRFQDASVVWSLKSDADKSLASIADGKLTVAKLPEKASSITVVATVKVGSVTKVREFTVKLSAAVKEVPNTSAVKIDVNVAPDTGSTKAKKVYTIGDIVITNEKAAASSDCRLNTDVAARFYAHSSLKIEYKEKIAKIVISCYDTKDDKYFPGGLADLEIEGVSIVVEQDTGIITIIFANPEKSFTIKDLPAQLRIATLEIFTPSSAS